MSIKSSKSKYGSVAIIFHWVTALLILLMIPLGLIMSGLDAGLLKENLYRSHIIIGLLVFSVTIGRVIWRFIDNKPNVINDTPKVQHWASKFVHIALYGLMMVLSISGTGFMVLSGLGETLFFEQQVTNWPNPQDYAPAQGHYAASRVLMALLSLHVGAALYHQFWVKDGLIKRMWFAK